MDFKDHLRALAERVVKLKDSVLTEEATKNALIMPFIQALGYDVFNPTEVVPEFVADVGTKKGEKVDYAILRAAKPIIIIECKHWTDKLSKHDTQLIRYFNVTKARFAILTNGIRYCFFTDLAEPNMMDEKPFLDFDITEIKEQQAEELKKFHKSYFDEANILSSATEMKYTNELKALLNQELKSPSEGFVKFFAAQVFKGRLSDKVVFQFSDLVKKSIHSVIGDIITDRLKTALETEKQVQAAELTPTSESEQGGKEKLIDTTSEEMEGFFVVKSILRLKVDAQRITIRDTQSYCSVLLDDNIRKAICRLYFNGTKKYIGYFDETKKEVKFEITKLDDIYKLADQLGATVETYLSLKA